MYMYARTLLRQEYFCVFILDYTYLIFVRLTLVDIVFYITFKDIRCFLMFDKNTEKEDPTLPLPADKLST